MHILLTRPIEDCSEMIVKFQSLDHKVSHLPLINVQKVQHEEINSGDYGGLIFKVLPTSVPISLNLSILPDFFS